MGRMMQVSRWRRRGSEGEKGRKGKGKTYKGVMWIRGNPGLTPSSHPAAFYDLTGNHPPDRIFGFRIPPTM